MYKQVFTIFIAFLSSSTSGNCQSSTSSFANSLNPTDFQVTLNGKQVGIYFLKNGQLTASITNFGARIVSLNAPSRSNEMADVIVGFKSIQDYLKAKGLYHGAIIGRVTGRIADGALSIDKKSFTLQLNNPPNHLHGGINGFHNQVWDVQTFNDTSIVLSHYSVDEEMGYPGNLKIQATYILNSKNELILDLTASTDKTTLVNMTNHAFFNLGGEGSGTILNHELNIPAKYICTIAQDKLPTGKIIKVKNTPFDFNKTKTIGQDLVFEKTNDQLKFGSGYDHHFVLSKDKSNVMKLAAIVIDPQSGRKLEVFTNEPCIHFFTANFFKGDDIGKMGKPINFRESFAIETQRFPFSSNQRAFRTILLRPGKLYKAKTIYRFTISGNA